MEDALNKFFENQVGRHYLITDINGYTTVLRVDNVGLEAVNTFEFINNHIGKFEKYSFDDQRFDFTVGGKNYYLFNCDSMIISI